VTVEFDHRTLIDAPMEIVFDLSLSIDAHVESMADSGERAVAGVTSGHIGMGEQVTWKATHSGIPFTMTSRVTELARPTRFVDEQVRGPFRRFHHTHEFRQVEDSTLMLDRICFDAPLWLLGDIVERLLLGRYLERLINERGEYLRAAAEGHRGPDSDGQVGDGQ
jgi:ligand-binding SRPBCC domain-containing protein